MITIVTDSTVYLTRKQAANLGVCIVPMSYTVSSKPYYESYIGENGNFEKQISENVCKTSQTPINGFLTTFEQLLKKGSQVLCLVLSSRLSGTFSSASIAKKQLNSNDVQVVDTKTTAAGTAILIEKALELIEKGLSLEEIQKQILDLSTHVGIAFSVDDMDSLRKSGRLSAAKQSVSTLLNVRPILKLEKGAVVPCGVARGKHGQVKDLLAMIPKDVKEITIMSIGEKVPKADLEKAIVNQFPDIVIKKSTIGPILAIHLGISCMGVAWLA